MATTTNISLHLITSIEAVDYNSQMVLRLKSRYGDTDITMFFDIGDTGLTKRLVEAINAAIVGPILPPPDAACPHEAAAYHAAAIAYDDVVDVYAGNYSAGTFEALESDYRWGSR